jgi:DNA-binding NarL/FixJ family response regulator
VTSIVLADDQELVRTGLVSVVRTRGVEVLGEAADGAEAVELVERTRPDVAVMDIRMPVLDGIAATREIVRRRLPTRVLVVTTFDLDTYVYDALRAGAAGFLLKATTPDRLVDGIRTVAAGESLLDPSLTRRLIEAHVARPAPASGTPRVLAALSERELDVVRLVARGLTNTEVAGELFVSPATVKSHVNRIFAKLGLETRVQLVVIAYECGFVVPGASPRPT